MKKALTYIVVLAIIALGAYFFFIRGSGGLKVEESITTKTANSTSVSKSSTSKTPTAGLILEKGDIKVTVIEFADNKVSFTANVNKSSSNCVPGSDNETFSLKRGEKITLNSCNNAEKTYKISF